MGLTYKAPDILGSAVFGTSDGLRAEGNGIFARAGQSIEIFEFEIGRSSKKLLHTRDNPKEWVVFRRLIQSDTGAEYEMLGCILGCRDAHGRAGFFGACVAVEPDGLKGAPVLTDWKAAWEQVEKLCEKADGFVSGERFYLQSGAVPATHNDRAMSFSVAGSDMFLFHFPQEPESVSEPFQYLQAIAFQSGASMPTVLAFLSPVEGSESLVGAYGQDCMVRLEKSVADRQRAIEAKLQSDKTPQSENDAIKRMVEASLQDGAPPSGQTYGHAFEDDSVEMRLQRLEGEVASLRSQLSQLRMGGGRGQPQDDTFDNRIRSSVYHDDEARSSKWFNVIIGVSIVILLLIAAYLAATMFLSSDADDEISTTIEEPADLPATEGAVAPEPAEDATGDSGAEP
jgi:hypothetical protein